MIGVTVVAVVEGHDDDDGDDGFSMVVSGGGRSRSCDISCCSRVSSNFVDVVVVVVQLWQRNAELALFVRS